MLAKPILHEKLLPKKRSFIIPTNDMYKTVVLTLCAPLNKTQLNLVGDTVDGGRRRGKCDGRLPRTHGVCVQQYDHAS